LPLVGAGGERSTRGSENHEDRNAQQRRQKTGEARKRTPSLNSSSCGKRMKARANGASHRFWWIMMSNTSADVNPAVFGADPGSADRWPSFPNRVPARRPRPALFGDQGLAQKIHHPDQ
jgi:hypothetical protein